MPSLATRLRRNLLAGQRRLRELQMIGKGLLSTDHIVQAHIIPMRRCNLACTYCNEYDDFSKPVDVNIMIERVDHLAKLGATLIMISGGEPLLHPELEKIIARIRHHGRIAGMITNGYLLMPDRIQRLNDAKLDHLQISIDTVMPDDVSKKSLKVLDKKLSSSKPDRGIVTVESRGFNQRGEEVCYFRRRVMVYTQAALPARQRPYETP